MFKNKRDVDRHVSHILNRIREEKERNARGYQFAKLYYDIADYESGRRYLQAFLSVRETVPQAHKLMGQIQEALRDKGKAIEAYKRCLDLDPDQKDVVLKVCELYSDIGVNVTKDIAKYWIERAEKHFPGDQHVFKLKERIVENDGAADDSEMERLITTELLKKADDVKLHVKLLRLYMRRRDVDRAFDHAVNTEKSLSLVQSAEWYECLLEVFQVYADQHGGTDSNLVFHTHKLFAASSLALLRLQSDERDVVGATKALQVFDEDLHVACAVRSQSAEWSSFLTEMKGRLFYVMGLMLFKRALKGQVSWKDCGSFSSVCFLLSDSFPFMDIRSSWFVQSKPEWKRFYEHVYMTGCDRLSQGGHMIYSLLNKQEDSQGTRKLRQSLCTAQGRTSLYALVFAGADAAPRKERSYFVNSDIFTSTSLDVPAKSKLVQYDSVAYRLHCDDLNHLVWLALQHYSLRDDVQQDYEQLFGVALFPEMKYSMCDLSGGDPATLCQLDVQVFLYACFHWAALEVRERRRNSHVIPDKPDTLPAILSSGLCNKLQMDWWTAVNNMEKGKHKENLGKVWGVVTRGLETIRLVVPNALPLQLVVHVARILDARAKEIESLDAEGIVTPKLTSMQTRAAFYWAQASDMLERMDRNQSVRMPKEMMFPLEPVRDPAVVKETREQVKFAMAIVAMNDENYREALSAFENIYKPESSYYSGLIYRKMAESSDLNNSSGNGQQMVLLSKSKTALYQALDRLETDRNEEMQNAIRRDLDDVVCKLISLESGGNIADSILSNASNNGISEDSDDADENDDDEDAEPHKHPSPRTPKTLQMQSMRVSPTRLDVQLRALESSNTALSARLSTLEDTVKASSNLIQEIFIQLRQSRDENKSLREQLQILSLQGLSSISMVRPPMPQQPTPRMNTMNMSMGSLAGLPGMPFELPGQGGLPPHMTQYGLPPSASPRPGSGYGHSPAFEDSCNNIDGEYYDPDGEEFYMQDQNLVQEWPFGQKAGVEGKSTITYSPQPRAMNPSNPGMFANALRGPSIQYGMGYQSLVPPQQQMPAPVSAPMPGPGFFSQNNQQFSSQGVTQTQQSLAGVVPGSAGMFPRPTLTPSHSPAIPPSMTMTNKTSTPVAVTSKPATPMMPPNAVITTQSSESKPKLIPGSVGVPASSSSAKTTPLVSPAMGAAGPLIAGSASAALSNLAAKSQEDVNKTQSPVAAPVTPQRTVFKGFSFSSTPKISEPKEEPENNNQTAATTKSSALPKPFSGFSLTPSATKPAAVSTSTPATQPSLTSKTGTPSSAGFIFGQGSTASFDCLAAQGQTATSFQASGDQKGFSGAGLPVFGKNPSPRLVNTSANSDEPTDEYEPNVDFKPVIQLPDLIEVKTGEEEEEKLFCERAKLFRFDQDSGQWKERGIGEIKILRHRVNKSVRILMRREQVLKLCANHKISPEMKLSPMAASDCAWVWNTMDFSEGEAKPEKFAIKFKTPDIADKFRVAFEKSQSEMESQSDVPKADISSKADQVTSSKKGDAPKEDLASMFKKKEGTWTCDGCYVNNGADIQKCLCCGTLKPGVKAEDIKAPAGASSFGSSVASGGFTFNTSATAAAPQTGGGFKFGSTQQSGVSSSSGSGFTFGTSSTSTQQTKASGFSFGTPTTTSAGSSAVQSAKPASAPSGAFVFGGGSTPSAGFGSVDVASSGLFGAKPKTTVNTENKTGFVFGGMAGKTQETLKSQSDGVPSSAGFDTKAVATVSSKANSADENSCSLSGSLLAQYLSTPDIWKCTACEVNNEEETVICVKCGVTRPSEQKPFSSLSTFQFGSSDKQSPFAVGSVFGAGKDSKGSGFKFGNPSSEDKKPVAEGFNFTFNPQPSTAKDQPPASLTSGFNFSLNMTPSKKESPLKSRGFMSPKSPGDGEEEYYADDGEDSHIHFEPVIELPDKVDVKTGEEDEEVIFSHRAKLFRYTKGEWKERGLGDVKILYQPQNNKARIVMRREQILKLCCNHYITADLSLKPMPNTKGVALIWYAMDFTEGEPKPEQFSIKFKNEEIAQKFQKAVDEAKSKVTGASVTVSSDSSGTKPKTPVVETLGPHQTKDLQRSEDDVVITKVEEATPEEVVKARALQLPDNFYMYTRLKDCPGCRGCNDDLSLATPVSTRAGKENMEVREQTNVEEEEDEEEEDEHDDDDDYEDVDDEAESEEDNENVAEAEHSAEENEGVDKIGNAADKGGESGVFGFGGGSAGFSFAALAQASSTKTFATDSSQPFHWQGAGKQVFGSSTTASADGDDDDAVAQGDDPHFEPIVPLPDLIDVKTGEEDETPVYSQRSKLFRFDKDAKQWKEKGIGEMKILKHKGNGKYRLLLRREQVHKLACNHHLTSDLVFTIMATSETSWCWTAQDYSENQPRMEQFALKFKNVDTANVFKAKIDEIQSELRGQKS